MFNLNLTDPDKSEVKFEVQRFPDGQIDVRLLDSLISHTTAFPGLRDADVKIYARVNSFNDLAILLSATAALRRLYVKDIFLHLPYLLGARSDRKFVRGGTSWLVDVLAPILRAQNYRTINVLDVHSDVAAACLPNLLVETNAKLVQWAIEQSGSKNYCIAAPDAGALKKVYGLAEEIKYTGPLLVGQKHRDLGTGKILSTTVDIPGGTQGKDVFIVDDICDGGRTFLELAKAIRDWDGVADVGKIYLIVTHGIFSAGYKELGKVFEHVYTTNSFKDVPSTDYDAYHTWPTKVSQFNVF
jgi:ribose-phosphate pyrophosphokinase